MLGFLIDNIPIFVMFVNRRHSYGPTALHLDGFFLYSDEADVIQGLLTCGTGTEYPSGAPAFAPGFTCLSGVSVVHEITCLHDIHFR